MESQGKYYSAIDGLRAIAVGLVLLYHAGFSFARGGFIGVDIFFVISGFLITGVIARNIEARTWSFGKFYLRRIARLTPALLVTVLATLAAGYFILAPDDLARLGQSSIYAAASVSNFFFWQEAGYFDQTATTKPLLHTWSLGVEEQFYFIWPAIIFLLMRWRGRTGAAIGLAVLGIFSLIAAARFEQSHPDAVFFMMPFRTYQFALGGLLALLVALRATNIRNIAGFFCLIILFAVAFSGGDEKSYWMMAVVPALAAAAFIWSAEARLVKTVFASGPFRWVGKRSYSIYLVHWPIMVLWPMATDFDLSPLEGALGIGVSILAGAILQGVVEKPFRFRRNVTANERGRSIAFTAVVFVACTFVGAHYWALSGFPERVPEEIQQYTSLKKGWDNRLAAVRAGVCNLSDDASEAEYSVEKCASPPNDKPAYMIIGDSYAAGASMVLPAAYKDVYFGQFSMPGCHIRAPNALLPQPKRPWCERFYERAYDLVIKKEFDGVIISAAWGAERRKTANELISWAKQNNLDIVLLSDRPRFRDRVPAIISRSMSIKQAEKRVGKAESPIFKKWAYDMEADFGDAVKVVNMHKVMCDDRCMIFSDTGELLYLDASHISYEGVEWFGRRLRDQYPDLFRR